MAVNVGTYAAKQNRVAAAAEADLRAWLAENPGAAMADISAEVIDLAAMYGDAAAEMAVEYYADLRAAVEGIVEWEPAAYQGFPGSYLEQWINDVFDPLDPDWGMLDVLYTAVQQAGRDTIARNTRRDPASARWARMPIGKTCAWCLMLASRGAVYFTKESAGGTGVGTNRYHGHCDCQPVPVWRGQEPPYDADQLFSMWNDARSHADGSQSTDVTASFRRLFPDLVSDGVILDA